MSTLLINHPMMTTNGSYELYDGRAVHHMNSHEDELMSPPGGPSCRPTGNPKQTRDMEMEKLKQILMKSQQESNLQRKVIEDLRKRLHDLDENIFTVSSENSDEGVKDSTIRQLQRSVTIYQANQFKQDQRIQLLQREKEESYDRLIIETGKFEVEMRSMRDQVARLEAVVKHKNEEIERLHREKQANKLTRSTILTKESCDSASPPSSSPSTSQTNGTFSVGSTTSQSHSMDSQPELEYLHRMVDMLRSKVMEQRDLIIKLGLTSGSFNNLAQGQKSNSTSASMPAQNFLLPTSRPDDRSSVQEAPSSPHNTSNNIATTSTATIAVISTSGASAATMQQLPAVQMVTRPVRQAEESCEMITSAPKILENSGSLKVHNSSSRGNSKENTPPPPSPFYGADSVTNGNTNRLSGSVVSSAAVAENNTEILQLPYLGVTPGGGGSGGGSPRRSRPGSVSEMLSALDRLNMTSSAGTIAENNDIYMNDPNPLDRLSKQEHLADPNDVFMDTPLNDVSGPRQTPVTTASRKLSQSEIIGRRSQLMEGVTLPQRSRTEIISKNPNVSSSSQHYTPHSQQQQQLQQLRDVVDRRPIQLYNQHPSSDTVRLPYPPPDLQAKTPTTTATQYGTGVAGGIPGIARPPPSPNNTWHNSHFPPNPPTTAIASGMPPYAAEGCVVSPIPSSYSNTLSNISDVKSSSASSSPTRHPFHHQPHHQQQRTTGAQRLQDNSSSSSNRICPVCNQDFGHMTMENFQAHVFDCFDDNGPETLQAENEMVADLPPLWDNRQGLGPGPNRTCPMCQQKFDISVTQPEFEQHVHRHFGEEAFEEL